MCTINCGPTWHGRDCDNIQPVVHVGHEGTTHFEGDGCKPVVGNLCVPEKSTDGTCPECHGKGYCEEVHLETRSITTWPCLKCKPVAEKKCQCGHDRHSNFAGCLTFGCTCFRNKAGERIHVCGPDNNCDADCMNPSEPSESMGGQYPENQAGLGMAYNEGWERCRFSMQSEVDRLKYEYNLMVVERDAIQADLDKANKRWEKLRGTANTGFVVDNDAALNGHPHAYCGRMAYQLILDRMKELETQ